MRAWSRLLSIEKAALILLALFLALQFARDTFYRLTWLGRLALLGLLAATAFALVLWGFVRAGLQTGSRQRQLRTGPTVPLAILAAFPLGHAAFLGDRWTFGLAHLEANRASYEAQIAAAPHRTRAFTYSAGISDSGVSIVHSGKPAGQLHDLELDRLVNGQVHGCRHLRRDDYLCSFG